MEAANFVALLRSEAQALANNANVKSIDGITFLFTNGTERTIKLNTDKTWRSKPTTSNGVVNVEWKDALTDYSSLMGGTYTILERVEALSIDPTNVMALWFDYKYKTVADAND